MKKKHFRNLSSEELRTVAGFCAAAAVLLGVAVVMSDHWSQGSTPNIQSQDQQKPWAMELP
jgi:hypothetical protein